MLSQDYESFDAGAIEASTLQAAGWTLQSKNGKNAYQIVQGAEDAANKTKFFDFYYPDGGASRNQSWNLGVADNLNADNWTLSFSAVLNPGTNNSSNKLYIVGTKTGQVTSANNAPTNPLIKLEGTDQGAETYKVTIGETVYDSEITLNKADWYKFTISAAKIDNDNNTEDLTLKITTFDEATTVFEQTVSDLSTTNYGTLYGFCWNSPRGYSRLSLDDVIVSKEVPAGTCDNATGTVTGVNGTARYFTLACGTAGATIYWATSNLDADASGWTEYTGVTSTDAATIYLVAKKGTAKSEVTSLETGAGTEVVLNAPTLAIADLANGGSTYTVSINATSNQSSVLFAPTDELSAEFTPTGGSAKTVSLPFTPTESGVLTVTANATGYTSASSSMPVAPEYTLKWQSLDYSSLVGEENVQAALGDVWTLSDGHGRWASWNKDKDGSYNFYANSDAGTSYFTLDGGNIRMRGVVVLAEGMGLGRNITGGEAIQINNTKAGEIVQFEIYNGYGNDIEKGTNTYISYAVSNGVDRPAMNSTNAALLVQAAVYTPTTYAFEIGAEGWATLYTDRALDFSSTGLTAYTATTDGTTVTLTEVTEVAAGTGVVLKGDAKTYEIPVIESSDTEKGQLKGSATAALTFDAEAANDYYMLVLNSSSKAQFKKLSSGTIAAGKAYLAIAKSTEEARVMNVVFAGTTAIKAIETVAADNNVYNLAGQRVAAPQKGLYIVNGKKVIVK